VTVVAAAVTACSGLRYSESDSLSGTDGGNGDASHAHDAADGALTDDAGACSDAAEAVCDGTVLTRCENGELVESICEDATPVCHGGRCVACEAAPTV
jgi:hypothetical protein